MISARAKRVLLALALFFAVVLVVALVGAYMLSRDVPFDWQNPNVVEANRFKSKLTRYENAMSNGQHGFVRFSQLEINSYIRQAMTNQPDTNAAGVHLTQVGVELINTNLMLYSWGEYRIFSLPLRFVVQRSFNIQQEGANPWETTMESFKVGEVEVPRRYWDSMNAFLEPMDGPVKENFGWRTNIPALSITKNELSQRPELRLYTYKPISAEEIR